MKQRFWIKVKIIWHCLRKRHRFERGFQHAMPLIFCQCGYYKPRVNPRDGESFEIRKHITDPEMKKLLKLP